jgi:hypothetical protein
MDTLMREIDHPAYSLVFYAGAILFVGTYSSSFIRLLRAENYNTGITLYVDILNMVCDSLEYRP